MTQQYDILAIQAALVAAGVDVGAGLGSRGDEFYAGQADGSAVPIPPEAIAALGALPLLADPSALTAAADVAAFTALEQATTLDELKAVILAWMAARPGIAT